MDYKDIIDRIIQLRHQKGLTQKALANLTSINREVIARIETKKVAPRIDTLVKIIDALEAKIIIK